MYFSEILESLSKELLFDYITYLQEENERLNNIINELEKYIETEIKFQKIIDRDYELRKVLIKLIELKEKDN